MHANDALGMQTGRDTTVPCDTRNMLDEESFSSSKTRCVEGPSWPRQGERLESWDRQRRVQQQIKKAKLDLSVRAGATRVGTFSVAERWPQANILGQNPSEQDSSESNSPLPPHSFQSMHRGVTGGRKTSSLVATKFKVLLT